MYIRIEYFCISMSQTAIERSWNVYLIVRIAECISQALPYADVMSVQSEREIEVNLEMVDAPISFRTNVEIGGQTFNAERELGCFIRGAGKSCFTYVISVFKSESLRRGCNCVKLCRQGWMVGEGFAFVCSYTYWERSKHTHTRSTMSEEQLSDLGIIAIQLQ